MTSHAKEFSNNRKVLSAADILCLAAAPTFAVMALLTGAFGQSPMPDGMMPETSPIGGMVPMYVLMAAFHSAPWLRLISRSRGHDAASKVGENQ